MSAKTGSFEKEGRRFMTIELSEERQGHYRFSFGLAKARLILTHIPDIKKFVEENSQPQELED